LSASDHAVTIDGVLDDWTELPYVVEDPVEIDGDESSWTGAADCSYRFGIRTDQRFLYIAIEVIDESPVYLQKVPWQQDGIEVRLDGRPDPARSNNRGESDRNMANYLFIGLSPDPDPAKMSVVESERLAELGIKAISVPTINGHNTEIAVPLTYLEKLQGADWQRIRLNIAVDDFDAEDNRLAQV